MQVFKTFGVMLAITTSVYAPVAQSAGWIKAESDHFVVYSNTPEKVASTYLTRLEQYRYILTRFHGQTAEDDAQIPKLPLYFLDNFRDLQQTWPDVNQNVAGYFKACIEGQAAFSLYHDDISTNKGKVQNLDENTSQIILFHEYAHNFMFQTSAQKYPAWFVEGFAEFYSTAKMQGDQAIVGMESAMRGYSLSERNTVSYDKLLRGDPSIYRSSTTISAFYAQSWLLTHYILSDPDRKKAFRVYLTAYNQGDDAVTAFETAFNIKVKDLGRLLGVYERKDLMATVYRIKDMPTPKITVSVMPASAKKLLLWDAADRICPAPANSAKLLTDIRSESDKYPQDDYAGMVKARADIIIGNEWDAVPYLLKYTADHPKDAEGLHLLGQAWYLMTRHKHILTGETASSQMQKARDQLGNAYETAPLNAATLYYLANAMQDLPGYPDENAVNAAVNAHYLAPSVDEYAGFAANLLIFRDYMDEAKVMLYPLANNPHNKQVSQWASGIIDAIESGATKDEVLKRLNTQAAPTDAPDTPAPADPKTTGKSDKAAAG
jgi:tetratricopeptide (TPR) repeat protein